MTVKLKLKELRKEKGVTQRELAAMLATTETNYRRIESQSIESISYLNIDKLCKYFECNLTDLMEFVND